MMDQFIQHLDTGLMSWTTIKLLYFNIFNWAFAILLHLNYCFFFCTIGKWGWQPVVNLNSIAKMLDSMCLSLWNAGHEWYVNRRRTQIQWLHNHTNIYASGYMWNLTTTSSSIILDLPAKVISRERAKKKWQLPSTSKHLAH